MSSIFTLEGLSTQIAGQGLGFGLGFALGQSLLPEGVRLAQAAWSNDPGKAPDAILLAEGVAQGQVDPDAAKSWARENGYGDDQWAALVNIANTGPPLGLAYEAWRRGELSDDEFTTALRRTGLEVQWDDALKALKQRLLEPAQIAQAIHRGIIPGQGLLVTEPPSTPGKVPMVPPSSIDAIDEAAGSGFDSERLRVMVGNAGLPPGIVQMLQLLNRGEITEDDFQRGVGESNLRNEWGPAVVALRRQLLTAHDYVEAQIRGYIDRDQRIAGTQLHGMTDDDSDLLFLNSGRPLALHQITTGLARGGVFQPLPGELTDPYDASAHESSLHPSYYDLWKANRYTIPSYFVLTALIKNGSLSVDEGADYFKQLGWPPDLADKAADAAAGGTAGKADPYITKAQTQLWSRVHSSYLDDEATLDETHASLTALGITSESQTSILELWDRERALVRLGLTPTQIKKAIGQPGKDEAWALERLHELGMDADDAATFLAE